MKKIWFFGVSGFIFNQKPLKNHDFWIFVVTKNAKFVIFDWFLCIKFDFSNFVPAHLLKKPIKNHTFIFWNFGNMLLHWFFNKNGSGQNSENQIWQKINRKLQFSHFSNHKNSKIMIFQWLFIKNELWHP